VLRWILDAYAKRFRHVLLGWQFGSTFGDQQDEAVVIKGEDYRDGQSSAWFVDAEWAACLRLFPRHPLYAERCYRGGMEPEKISQIDPKYGQQFKTWRDMDRIALDEALEHHANTFDLRTVADVKRFKTYPGLVERFKRDTLASVVLNTRRDGAPDIQLALQAPRFVSWYALGAVEVVP
jgi:hypothetical protein